MSDEQRDRINTAIDIIYKLGTPIGLAALFWLNNTFASVEEVKQLGERLTKVETAIQLLVKDAEVNGRQDAALQDHEGRLRSLEFRRASQ
jgi:hypothetical protein